LLIFEKFIYFLFPIKNIFSFRVGNFLLFLIFLFISLNTRALQLAFEAKLGALLDSVPQVLLAVAGVPPIVELLSLGLDEVLVVRVRTADDQGNTDEAAGGDVVVDDVPVAGLVELGGNVDHFFFFFPFSDKEKKVTSKYFFIF
jgi:hypothetical protein